MKEEYISTLSALTNLPESLLGQVCKLNMLAVSDELYEQLYCSNEGMPKVTLSTYGELKLNINREDNKVEFRFMPSAEFNATIRQTILQKQNLLQTKLESKLVEKIKLNYDDVLDGALPQIDFKKKATQLKKEVTSQLSNLKNITNENAIEIVLTAFNILIGRS